VNKLKTFKGACLVAATAMLPLSQAAIAEVTISGWVNQGVQFYDDGETSDAFQLADNGTTLGDRITISGSSEVSTGITAGFEYILEPDIFNTSLIFTNQTAGLTSGVAAGDTNNYTSAVSTLSANLFVSGAWGKVTVGLQSMPTDNIAVLEDPSLTLWSGISPIFRGNGFTISQTAGNATSAAAGTGGIGTLGAGSAAGGAVWGDFLNCFASGLRGSLGIGLDCNGIYRNGIRYDLPAFGPVTIAIGWANDDIYDINGKWKGSLGRMKGSIALGYAVNNGVNGLYFDEAENFQLQAGLMDPETGLFGSIAYQHEENDLIAGLSTAPNALGGTLTDDSDAWWLKVGIKKQWFSIGDTSISFDYGQYSDQYGAVQAAAGVNGSEVDRIGVAVDQYFGSSLIIYGKWEQLDLDVDTAAGGAGITAYGGTDELDTFTLGAVYFF